MNPSICIFPLFSLLPPLFLYYLEYGKLSYGYRAHENSIFGQLWRWEPPLRFKFWGYMCRFSCTQHTMHRRIFFILIYSTQFIFIIVPSFEIKLKCLQILHEFTFHLILFLTLGFFDCCNDFHTSKNLLFWISPRILWLSMTRFIFHKYNFFKI